ncbi:MAG: alpha/beta hydrolase fold domain-containing protein [Planctomycetes bacterium]|nr:alpha/beta hydrolase fold domain-containing protein [Planctomycetota bacterium]
MRPALTFLPLLALIIFHFGLTTTLAQQNQRPPLRSEGGDGARRGRFTFEQFSARHDTNQDGQVDREEFKGAPQFFRWLDENGDDVITSDEFKARTRRNPRQEPGSGRRVPDGVKILRDLEYAAVDGQSLRLDLYLPEEAKTKPPLLVWIHGGGWSRGSKSQINPTIARLAAEGYAAASIDYRLEGLVSHPKQIHDCKGAIRWLRANADRYGYDTTRIGVGGGSAGGHLALLLGLSDGVEELEGSVGGNGDKSSRVHAVVDLFGPSALELFARQSERFAHNKASELLESASPVTHLSEDDPPVLVFHGDKDQVVPVGQSEYLHQRYQEAGLESALYIIKGAGHGGPQFSDPTRYALVKEFFDRHIKQPAADYRAGLAVTLPSSLPEQGRTHSVNPPSLIASLFVKRAMPVFIFRNPCFS